MLGNPKQSWILDSKPWIPDSRHLIPVFSKGTLDWIPILSRIPDSLGCIPDSKVQDSGFHKQKFHGFHDPDSLTWPTLLLTSCYISSIIIWPQCKSHVDHNHQQMNTESVVVNRTIDDGDWASKWIVWCQTLPMICQQSRDVIGRLSITTKYHPIVLEDSKFEWWVSIRSVVFRFDICHFIVSPTFGFCSVSLFNFWL